MQLPIKCPWLSFPPLSPSPQTCSCFWRKHRAEEGAPERPLDLHKQGLRRLQRLCFRAKEAFSFSPALLPSSPGLANTKSSPRGVEKEPKCPKGQGGGGAAHCSRTGPRVRGARRRAVGCGLRAHLTGGGQDGWGQSDPGDCVEERAGHTPRHWPGPLERVLSAWQNRHSPPGLAS